ncbi:MAG TPA: DNA internalization-related competence protein ComEC/Rec2, partial [Gammaproteobacteria bacterium]|nr:DNA internalization-related competence protein ComEC/Rec2 [Gammaproteobacteria bacterium]
RLPGAFAMYDLEAAALASAVGAFLYTALAGFGVPAQRSLVMLAVALAVLMARRDVGAANGLAFAALAVLIRDPFAPTSASFWLSFGAVALLLLIATRREVGPARGARGARFRHGSLLAVSLQVAMSFGSVPFVALYFSRVSLVSPLANLLAVPYFNIALEPATLAGVLGVAAGIPGAVELLHVAGRLTDWAWAGIHIAASLPWASVGVAPPASWSLGLALAGVAAAMPAHPLPGRLWAWCALLPLLLARAPRPPPGAAEVTMLDVGHGLAVIVETRTHRLLYDAGPRSPSGYDSGREIVVPALSLEPRAGLDRLIVSHADADHSGGAASVLAAFPGADVLKGPDVTQLPGRTCAQGQHWQWDGVEFEMLYPPPGSAPLGNDSSCVLKITTIAGSVLLDGDIEARAEQRLIEWGGLAADVVAVPHHGSPTSSTARFVQHTGARYALVSAGFPSRWNFPRPEVVARWQAEGADVWVTGRSGALTVTLDGRGIRVTGERLRRKRYWRTFSKPSPGMPQQRGL